MAEEPEEMLEKQRITAGERIIEASIKVTISEKHSNSAGEYRE